MSLFLHFFHFESIEMDDKQYNDPIQIKDESVWWSCRPKVLAVPFKATNAGRRWKFKSHTHPYNKIVAYSSLWRRLPRILQIVHALSPVMCISLSSKYATMHDNNGGYSHRISLFPNCTRGEEATSLYLYYPWEFYHVHLPW